MKAVILARVSTKEQEDGHSLKAQIDRLKEYCQRKNLEVLKEFVIVESSTRGDRPEFYKMLEFIKSQKQQIALVCDKVDRLQRGFKEVPILEELRTKGKLVLHFNQENQILDNKANSSQLMAYHMFVLMSANYTNCISDNVRRSFEKKLREGTILGSAPLGYLNTTDDKGNKSVEFDPERFMSIRKLFKEYSTGLYSQQELCEMSNSWGLRTLKGKKISKQTISYILENPFYKGQMKYHGNLYPHYYPVLVDKLVWHECQKIKAGKKTSFLGISKDFIFKGLIRCPECNCLYSSEIKKEKYIYLRPNNKNNCSCKSVNENIALKTIEEGLKRLYIPQEKLLEIKQALKNSLDSKKEFSKHKISALRNEYDKKTRMIENLLDMKLQDSITQAEYDKKYLQLSADKHNINAELNRFDTADDNFATTLEVLLDMASNSHRVFKSSGTAKKRQIINLVFSNLQITSGNLEYSYKKPFNELVNLGSSKKWLG